jgi:hypothetical protein
LRSLKNVSSLVSVRNKGGQRLDKFYVLIYIIVKLIHLLPVASGFHRCAHVFRSLLRVFMHYPRCITLAVRTRKCRLLRHFRDVALTPVRITDITLSRMTLAPAVVFCPGIGNRSRQRRSKRSRKSKLLGPHIPYGLFQTKGEMCAKFGSD